MGSGPFITFMWYLSGVYGLPLWDSLAPIYPPTPTRRYPPPCPAPPTTFAAYNLAVPLAVTPRTRTPPPYAAPLAPPTDVAYTALGDWLFIPLMQHTMALCMEEMGMPPVIPVHDCLMALFSVTHAMLLPAMTRSSSGGGRWTLPSR